MEFNLIVAACDNFGIGIKGDLPWRLKNELKYFSRMTKRVSDPSKCNAVIMGRKTYFGVPPTKRPLPERLNIVLSSTLQRSELPDEVLLFPSLQAALNSLQQPEMQQRIENVWIVGGSGVYKEAMASNSCHRLYLTKIRGTFDCDTFFPDIPASFKEIEPEADIPRGIQLENGVEYEYKVLEKEQ